MRINIQDIKKTPGASCPFGFFDLLDTPDPELIGKVRIEGKVYNAGSRMLVHGSIFATALLTCSRCGDLFEAPLGAELDEQFLEKAGVPARGDDEPPADEQSYETYVDDELDLTDLVRQGLVMAAPLQPLCRPGCLGLCAMCGVNRNVTACDCGEDTVDPRWEQLKKLKPS